MMKYLQLFTYSCVLVMSLCLHLILNQYSLIIIELCIAIILTTLYLFIKDFMRIRSTHRTYSWLGQHHFLVILIIWGLFAIKFPYLWIYSPLLFIENKLSRQQFIPALGIIFVVSCLTINIVAATLIGIICLLTYLSIQEMSLVKSKISQSKHQIDQLTEINDRIQTELVRLTEIQDQQRQLSVLNERKRMTHEIHDILGHQLSSIIIQLNALALISKENHIQNKLLDIQEILNTSMDNIRQVIHAERATSTDIQKELQAIINDFKHCPVHFEYQVSTDMPIFVQHSLIQIIKEGLTNIHKHSNATAVTISLKEVNLHWILLIYDNGTLGNYQLSKSGIGLLSMEERVNQMKGELIIHQDKGFRIYITIPVQGGKDA